MHRVDIRRYWLGWDEPFLPLVADWLLRKAEKNRVHPNDPIWLKQYCCVLPGKRAIRRLQELLVLHEKIGGRAIVPPEFISSGNLPEILMGNNLSYLSRYEEEAVWMQVLVENPSLWKEFSPQAREQRAVASELAALWNLLGREGYIFSTAYALLESSEGFAVEDDQWKALLRLEEQFVLHLEREQLFERTTSRLEGLRQKPWACEEREIVLVGAVDLGKLHQQFLSELPCSVHILLPMPEEHIKGVGDHGQLLPEYWGAFQRNFGAPGIESISVEDPESEAAVIVQAIQGEVPTSPLQDISIVVADETHTRLLSETLHACNIAHHSYAHVGKHFTGFARWCARASLFLESGTFYDFVALLKNPWSDLLVGTSSTNEVLHKLKEVSEQCRPFILFPLSLERLPKVSEEMLHLLQCGDGFFQAFQGIDSPEDFFQLLSSALEKQKEDFQPEQKETLQMVLSYGMSQFVSGVSRGVNRVEGAFKAPMLFSMLAECARAAGTGVGADGSVGVELLGWLESLCDDASVLLVAGFHDEVIPGALREGVWLPGKAREILGLEHEKRKLARDYFFTLHAMHSRRRTLFICPRRSIQGDFYRPSRILFGGDKIEVLKQANAFFMKRAVTKRVKMFPKDFGVGDSWILENPIPKDLVPPYSLSVTSFRDYIRCPFRFYLKHILRVRTVETGGAELSALAFGNLFHEVVAAFGDSEKKLSVSSDEIANFLVAELHRQIRPLLGDVSKPSVEVQIQNLEDRLSAFALRQAEWREIGWEIRHVELPIPGKSVGLDCSGRTMFLSGRIDRIDYHPKKCQWMALDYKTSTKSDTPEKSHRKDEEWIDLQLPLYRYALQAMGYEENIGVGFISVPAKCGEIAFFEAPWSDVDYMEAEQIAKKVAEDVSQKKFWPPSEENLPFDEFADLLGRGQYIQLQADLESEEEVL